MENKSCTIAVDAMSGDYAPDAVIEGARLAVTMFERAIRGEIRKKIKQYKEFV